MIGVRAQDTQQRRSSQRIDPVTLRQLYNFKWRSNNDDPRNMDVLLPTYDQEKFGKEEVGDFLDIHSHNAAERSQTDPVDLCTAHTCMHPYTMIGKARILYYFKSYKYSVALKLLTEPFVVYKFLQC